MRTARERAVGFTLVELLVVVAVISLLVGILVPVVTTVIDAAEARRTQARVVELAGACYVYRDQTGYFPGQANHNQLAGSGGAYTGSQVLASCLFNCSLSDLGSSSVAPPVSGDYAPIKVGDLDKSSGGGGWTAPHTGIMGTVLDRASEPMAILYYPYRMNVSSSAVDQVYKYNDNAAYINKDGLRRDYCAVTGKDPNSFSMSAYNTEMSNAFHGSSFGASKAGAARSSGAFLMAAPGKDRVYFTGDDLIYPE